MPVAVLTGHWRLLSIVANQPFESAPQRSVSGLSTYFVAPPQFGPFALQ